MAKLTRVKALHEYAKLEVVKSAKPEDVFILIKKSDILGRSSDGKALLLNKDATVSEDIRKEDLDASGYGDDATDDMSSDAAPGMTPEEAKEHAGNLMKCRGSIMKAAGLGEEDMNGDNQMDQAPEQTAGESEDAYKARKAAFFKAKGNGGGATGAAISKLQEKVDSIPDLIRAAFEQGFAAQGAAPAQARPGTVVQKTAGQGNGTGGDKDERTKDLEKLEALKLEKRGLLDKIENKLPLDAQEQIRKSKVTGEILAIATKWDVST